MRHLCFGDTQSGLLIRQKVQTIDMEKRTMWKKRWDTTQGSCKILVAWSLPKTMATPTLVLPALPEEKQAAKPTVVLPLTKFPLHG